MNKDKIEMYLIMCVILLAGIFVLNILLIILILGA